MKYHVIGLMSGSSLDGLDIVFVELNENNNNWTYNIIAADCYEYDDDLINELQNAHTLNAFNYLKLHAAYGKFIGKKVNDFIKKNNLHDVELIASHGHTVFHSPENKFTSQLGDGAAIAATTGISTVCDLRAIDIALGGQGAPIVPVGEKLLWKEFDCFLNIGGIANISLKQKNNYTAFDVCPANRVLNMLANDADKKYDENGNLASKGNLNFDLLEKLNELKYYSQPFPKSLANNFGTDVVYPLVKSFKLSSNNELRTYVEHIVFQIKQSIKNLQISNQKLFITGGGAHNIFLIERIKTVLKELNIEIIVSDKTTVDNKEALIMALLGVLRLREENTVLASVTGALRNSIGGCIWIGKK